MSKLLINEPPLQVLPSLAVAIGLNEGIALQQLHYLLDNPKVGVVRDGFKWVFFTHDEWREWSFPFWSISTIARVWLSLEGMNLVISAQLDAASRDMRKYYRIDYEALEHVNLESSKTPHRRDVKGNTENHSENERFKALAKSLAELQGGGMNATDGNLLSEWMLKHDDKWIFNALAIARAKGARSSAYVDKILIGWEANGYPISREEQVKKAKRPANSNAEALQKAAELHGVKNE